MKGKTSRRRIDDATEGEKRGGEEPEVTYPEPFPVLDQAFLKEAVDGMIKKLSEPEYREELERTFEFSYGTTLEILRRLATVNSTLARVGRADRSQVFNEVIPGFIKMNISLSLELMNLMQKHSTLMLDILEDAAGTARRSSERGRAERAEPAIRSEDSTGTRARRRRKRIGTGEAVTVRTS